MTAMKWYEEKYNECDWVFGSKTTTVFDKKKNKKIAIRLEIPKEYYLVCEEFKNSPFIKEIEDKNDLQN
jgi:hypothetical protein